MCISVHVAASVIQLCYESSSFPSFAFLPSVSPPFPFSSLHPSSPFLLSHPLSSPPTLLPSSPFFPLSPLHFLPFLSPPPSLSRNPRSTPISVLLSSKRRLVLNSHRRLPPSVLPRSLFPHTSPHLHSKVQGVRTILGVSRFVHQLTMRVQKEEHRVAYLQMMSHGSAYIFLPSCRPCLAPCGIC